MKSLMLVSTLIFFGCHQPKCLKSHTEKRTSPMWIQQVCVSYDKNGLCTMWTTIVHPEYEYDKTICDEYEKEESK